VIKNSACIVGALGWRGPNEATAGRSASEFLEILLSLVGQGLGGVSSRTMTPAKNFSDFRLGLAQRLALYEFMASGNLLWRKRRDVSIVLEIQRDHKCSSKRETRFTINVGLFVEALKSADENVSSSSVPSPERCHSRQRLGHFGSTQGDIWWSVGEGHETQRVCETIAAEILNVALPKIESLASSEALIREWQEGRGHGLTDYERRLNLARLLLASGRNEEAQMAIQALEDGALGRSWAVSAKYEAKLLRKALDASVGG
jgi:hypothetical protein